jgi:hypothetical protein
MLHLHSKLAAIMRSSNMHLPAAMTADTDAARLINALAIQIQLYC